MAPSQMQSRFTHQKAAKINTELGEAELAALVAHFLLRRARS
jgi:hypothetical protein